MSKSYDLSDEKIETLAHGYLEPSNELFLTSSTTNIWKKLQKSINVDNISTSDIEKFRNYLTDLSKEREQRILRGKKRKSSFRQVRLMIIVSWVKIIYFGIWKKIIVTWTIATLSPVHHLFSGSYYPSWSMLSSSHFIYQKNRNKLIKENSHSSDTSGCLFKIFANQGIEWAHRFRDIWKV